MKRKGRYDNGVFLLLSAMILTPAKAVPVYAETIPAYTGYYGEVLETEGLLETVGLLETGGEKVFHMYAEDPKIARVDEETGEIHCLYPGTTRILLETEEEGEEKTQAIGSLQVEKRNVILCLQPVKQRGEADPDLTEEIRNQLQEYVIPAEADADSESEAASVDRVWRDAEPAGRESGTDSPDTGLRPEEGAAEGLEEDKKEGIEEGTEAGAEEGIETRAEKGADAGAEEVERVLSLVHWGYEDTAEGDEKGILREAGVSGIQLVFEEDERYCFNRNIAEYYPSYLTTIEDSAGSGRGDDSSNTEASGGNIPCADGIEGKDDKAPEETDERGAFGPLSAGDDSSNTEVSGENIPGAAEKPAETSDGESRPDPAESEGEIRPPIRILPEADIVPVIIPIRDGDTGAQAEKKADDSRIALQNGKDPADRTASVRTEAESRTSDKEPEERKLDPVKAFQEWKESILKETKLLGMANGTSVQGSTFPSLQLAGAVREQEVSGTVRILRSGSERGAEDVTERFLDRSADGSGYIGRQLEQIPENDGVYTLSVAYRDQ
ncbi:MAG: hypothetical protein Q4B22_11645, partial [Eubacteriales bacterium]|nr:hypothetical protein [Eubacteriales bacterium]